MASSKLHLQPSLPQLQLKALLVNHLQNSTWVAENIPCQAEHFPWSSRKHSTIKVQSPKPIPPPFSYSSQPSTPPWHPRLRHQLLLLHLAIRTHAHDYSPPVINIVSGWCIAIAAGTRRYLRASSTPPRRRSPSAWPPVHLYDEGCRLLWCPWCLSCGQFISLGSKLASHAVQIAFAPDISRSGRRRDGTQTIVASRKKC